MQHSGSCLLYTSKKAGTYESGEEGYLLEISNNKFILPGNGQDVADYLGEKLIGLRFRPFSISALSNPSIEAGDCAYITDRKNNTYQTFITSSTFQVGNQQKLSCGAETPSRNSASRYSQITQAYVDNRNQTEQQLTEYEKIVKMCIRDSIKGVPRILGRDIWPFKFRICVASWLCSLVACKNLYYK